MFRSNNPALNSKILSKAQSYGVGESMTIAGTVNKCFILLFLSLITASWVWSKFMQPITPFTDPAEVAQSMGPAVPFVMFGGIIGFVLVLVTIFKLQWSPVTAPLYALCEGFVLGGISAIMERQYPGIAFQAVALTFGTLFALLTAYRSGMIKVTDKFRRGLFTVFGAIMVVYVVGWVMSFFGKAIPLIHEGGPVGIIFSLVVVCVAALMLVMDFDMIERFSGSGAPRYMEWYGAMSLMITLVWLYFEILMLLAKLRGGRR